jgi:hypothetical protein
VDCFAVQVSLIFKLNGYHSCPLENIVETGVREKCAHPISIISYAH